MIIFFLSVYPVASFKLCDESLLLSNLYFLYPLYRYKSVLEPVTYQNFVYIVVGLEKINQEIK